MSAAAAAAERIETYDDFVKVHGLLLTASGLPQSLHRKLFSKLSSETFDGGSYFQIEPCEDGPQRRLVLTSESMPKDSDVFLIDHAWTFRLSDAYKQVAFSSSFSSSLRYLLFGCRENKQRISFSFLFSLFFFLFNFLLFGCSWLKCRDWRREWLR